MSTKVPHRNFCERQAPHHVGGPPTAWKRNRSIGLAFVDHLLVPNMASPFSEIVPVGREAGNRNTISFCPLRTKPISAPRFALYDAINAVLFSDRIQREGDECVVAKVPAARNNYPLPHRENVA